MTPVSKSGSLEFLHQPFNKTVLRHTSHTALLLFSELEKLRATALFLALNHHRRASQLTRSQLHVCLCERGALSLALQAEVKVVPAHRQGFSPGNILVTFHCGEKKFMFTPN